MTTPSHAQRDRAALEVLEQRLDLDDAAAANNLGVVYFQHDLYDDAVRCFARGRDADPTAAVIQANLERATQASGFADRHVAELRDALRGRPDDPEARWELAAAYRAVGQHDSARAELVELVSLDPQHVDGLIELALCERQIGDLDAAADWLERARALAPDRVEVGLFLGQLLYLQGRSEAAAEVLDAAAAAHPEHAGLRYHLGIALGDVGRHQDAREATRLALELDPALGRGDQLVALSGFGPAASRPDEGRTERLGEQSGDHAHLRLAVQFRTQGLLAEALREYRLALDRGEDRVGVLRGMAETLLLRRDPGAALELYDRLASDGPSAAVENERAVALHHAGRLQEAQEGFRASLVRESGYVLARNNLAITLAQLGRHEEAAGQFAEAIRGDPSLVIPRVNLGLLLHSMGRYRHALQAFRQVVDMAPDTAVAWNGIGLVLVSTDRIDDARNAFVRAIESDSRCAEAHYNLSFALSQLGDFDGALRSVTRAQTLDPYFVPQKFRFMIEAQLGEGGAALPDISADVSTDLGTRGLVLDLQQFEELFGTLERSSGMHVLPVRDLLAVARDYRGRGLLDLAAAEVGRAGARGADPVEAAVLLGTIYAERGLHGEALERFREARRGVPDHRDARFGEVSALLELGRAREALDDARTLARDGDDVDAMLMLARAEHAAGDPMAALSVIWGARRRAPQRADLLRLRGEIALDLAKPNMAREAFTQALELDPDDTRSRTALGATYEALGEHERAALAYDQALSSDPRLEEAALASARLHALRGDRTRAINLLVDFLLVEPSGLRTLNALAGHLFEAGRVNQAVEAVDRVLARDPDDLDALWLKARTLVRSRRFDEAVRCWERVAVCAPGTERARRARQHVRTATDLRRILDSAAA
jgi:tetratricopeptide (TPR) repeat protein